MPRYSDQIVDDSGYRRPVAGAVVYLLNADGTLAAATSPNPAITDDFGAFSFIAVDGVYTFDARNGGVSIAKGSIIIGTPPQYVGPQGNTGLSNNTRATLAALKAAAITDGTSLYDNSVWTWTTGDFTGQNDDVNVVAGTPALTVGAWVRQGTLLPNLVRDGRDNTTVFSALLTKYAGQSVNIPAGNPIRLTSTVPIPANTALMLPQGSAVTWAGPTSDGGAPIGVFKLSNGCSISVNGPNGSVARIEAATDMHLVYAVIARSVSDWRVTGIFGRRMNHLDTNAITPAGAIAQYVDVVTPKMKAAGDARAVNVCMNGQVVGGGCRFDALLAGSNSAGVALANAQNIEVRDARWDYAGHGCVSAGGNAAGNANGAVGNERKAANIFVSRCKAFYSSVGGIWGAMTDNLRISDCEVGNCEDVGFDSEGNTNSVFQGNKATDCKGGNYTTFYLNQNILFQANTSIVTIKERPHFKIYNDSQAADNGEITWDGGNFVTLDTTGYGSVNTDSGPCRFYTVKNATFTNTVLRADKLNMNQVRIQNNRFYFTYRSPIRFDVIRVAGLKSTAPAPARGFAIISDNHILSEPAQPPNCTAISLSMGDDNVASLGIVRNNDILMFVDGGPVAIYLEHSGSNGGTQSRIGAYHNRLLGPIQFHNVSVAGVFDSDGNRTENGAVIALSQV